MLVDLLYDIGNSCHTPFNLFLGGGKADTDTLLLIVPWLVEIRKEKRTWCYGLAGSLELLVQIPSGHWQVLYSRLTH